MSENRKNYHKPLELVAKGEVSKVIITCPDWFWIYSNSFSNNTVIVLNEKENGLNYSIRHNWNLEKLLREYQKLLQQAIDEIWDNTTWKEKTTKYRHPLGNGK